MAAKTTDQKYDDIIDRLQRIESKMATLDKFVSRAIEDPTSYIHKSLSKLWKKLTVKP